MLLNSANGLITLISSPLLAQEHNPRTSMSAAAAAMATHEVAGGPSSPAPREHRLHAVIGARQHHARQALDPAPHQAQVALAELVAEILHAREVCMAHLARPGGSPPYGSTHHQPFPIEEWQREAVLHVLLAAGLGPTPTPCRQNARGGLEGVFPMAFATSHKQSLVSVSRWSF